MPTYVAAAHKQYIFLATGKYFDNTFLRNFCPVPSAMVTTTSIPTSIPPSRELSNYLIIILKKYWNIRTLFSLCHAMKKKM